jgi:hypothetical protein
MRFIDDLRDDINSSILVQRPSSWNSACVLAQLQEEVSEYGKRPPTRQPDPFSRTQSTPPASLPLPPPPWKGEKQTTLGEDRRGANSNNMEDKWSTLRAYRRARGCVLSVQRNGLRITVVLIRFNSMLCRRYLSCFSGIRMLNQKGMTQSNL